MSDEKEKIEMGLGQKGEAPADAEITDLTEPAEDEVGGRYRRANNVICPYCSSVNRIIEETNYRMWFRCWRCSGTFQY